MTTLDTPRMQRFFPVAIGLAGLTIFLTLLTPVVATLALRLGTVDPKGKEGSLSLVLGVGALLAMIGNPLFGRLSDRTRGPWGMRRPWLVGGVVGGAIGLTVVAAVPSVPAILAGWCLAQLSYNAALAAVTATVPDQVPAEKRGRVSGIVGMAQIGGILLGVLLADQLKAHVLLLFCLPAVIAVVVVTWFAITLDDRRPSTAPAPFDGREFAGSFWVNPLRHPDFGWAWLTRFLTVVGSAVPLTYNLFFLADRLGRPTDAVTGELALVTLVNLGCTLVTSYLGGYLSDRLGLRKIFVIASAALMAVGLLLLAVAPGMGVILVAQAILGIGGGAFFAVDMALVTQVLPNPDTVGKDMGVINIANALPQSLAPAVAPLFLALGGYTALFVFAGASAILGAVLVTRIKGVK